MFGGQLQFSSDCAGSRKQPAQRGQAHNVDLLIVMMWGLDSRVAGNKEVSAIGSHLGDTVEAEQEKPRSSGEEQGGGRCAGETQSRTLAHARDWGFQYGERAVLCLCNLQESSSGSQYILMASLG